MDLGLANDVVVVTGGASGIGLAIVRTFLAEGSKVAIWDMDAQTGRIAEELTSAEEITSAGWVVDVTRISQLEAALGETVDKLGPVDHLVHCAAVGSGKFGFPFTNLSPDDWPHVLEINIQGMVNVAHTVAPAMMERKRGTMVFLASVAGQIGSPTDPPYSAAKAANINFAQCLAKDLAGYDVRVNTVCPGMVQTPLNKSVWQGWYDRQPEAGRKSYEEWAGEKIKQGTPLGRWQQPEDIADMAVFLSSKRARQITGQTINVDGGIVMHW